MLFYVTFIIYYIMYIIYKNCHPSKFLIEDCKNTEASITKKSIQIFFKPKKTILLCTFLPNF